MVAGHGMTSSNFELLTMWNGAKVHPLDLCISNIVFYREYENNKKPSKPLVHKFILCEGSLQKLVERGQKARWGRRQIRGPK